MLLCLSDYQSFVWTAGGIIFNSIAVILIKLMLTFADSNILQLMRSDTVSHIKVRGLISLSDA